MLRRPNDPSSHQSCHLTLADDRVAKISLDTMRREQISVREGTGVADDPGLLPEFELDLRRYHVPCFQYRTARCAMSSNFGRPDCFVPLTLPRHVS